MKWYRRSQNNAPPDKVRILVFSPEYEPGHEMRVRIMEGQFFRHAKDATHWAYVPEPGWADK